MNRLASSLLAFAFALSLADAQPSWTIGRTNLPGVTGATSVAFGNGRFVAALNGGSVTAGRSTDGVNWTAVSNSALAPQGTVVFTAGAFYLAAGGQVWRSADGDSWQQLYSSNTFSFRGIATNGRSMLVGTANLHGSKLLFSSDLATWQVTSDLPNTTPTQNVSVHDVAYVAGQYFATYDVMLSNGDLRGYAAATADGTTWSDVSALAGALFMTSGNGRLVARIGGSPSDRMAVTTDGQSFSYSTAPSGLGVYNLGGPLHYAGGRYLFTTSLNTSLDGANWTSLGTAALPANTAMADAAYGNGRYVAVGGSSADVIAVLAGAAPPVITSISPDRTVIEGSSVTLSIVLDNSDSGTTYQWLHDGAIVAGATHDSLTLAAVSVGDAGQYTCEVHNAVGTSTSDYARLTVVPIADASRIVNVSVLTSIDHPGDSFTVGFSLSGQGAKQVLARAVGPSLAQLGVGNVNPDPRLELYAHSTLTATNDSWGGSQALRDVFNQVGAFPLMAANSADAALVSADVVPGTNSMKVFGVNGATGVAIAEVYDTTAHDAVTLSTPRLTNVSVLKAVADGEPLTAGFVISGTTTKTILVRAVGPGLKPLGVTGYMADPRVSLYRSGSTTPIATNEDWGGDAALATAANSVSAFPLDKASKDAALLVTLSPGNYSAQGVSSVGGQLLVEIYEVP